MTNYWTEFLVQLGLEGEALTLSELWAAIFGVAILAYLAVTGSRQSRNTLATLFWPDYAAEQARAALRRDLAGLTVALPRDVLHTDRETVGMAHALQPVSASNGSDSAPNTWVWVDVDHFRNRLAACRAHGHAAHEVCPRCIAPLSDADRLLSSALRVCPSDYGEPNARASADHRSWYRRPVYGAGPGADRPRYRHSRT